MKISLLICSLLLFARTPQTDNLHQIRDLYQRAPEIKQDARRLDELMLQVDSENSIPVLVCYKGANEMIQAKYALNPLSKLDKFSKGKALIQKAIARDTLALEMRFIRYSIQSNLPAMLGYRDNLTADKLFLVNNYQNSKDAELKQMIDNYLKKQQIN